MKKQQKGITLIALVITIIILLILAGVTLNIVFNGGLIEKSQTAVDIYTEEQVKEKLELAKLNYKFSEISGEGKSFEDCIKEIDGEVIYDEEKQEYKVTLDNYKFILNKDLKIIGSEQGITSGETTEDPQEPEEKRKYKVTINKGTGIESVTEIQEVEEGSSIEIEAIVKNGYIFEKWNVITGVESDVENLTISKTNVKPTRDITIEALAIIEGQTTEIILNGNNLNGTKNGTLTGGEYAYNNPVIPVGFKILETTDASWKDVDNDGIIDGWDAGLVITDAETDGNEFVWVPAQIVEEGESTVNGLVEYKKWCKVGKSYDDAKITDVDLPSGVTSEQLQIKTYQGFYVARFEAGIPTDDSNLTKALTTASILCRTERGRPLSKKNQIPWNYISSMVAKENAENMYTGEHVKSGLLTGTAWDTIMQWYKNNDLNVEKDSSNFGNYYDAPVTEVSEYSKDQGATWKNITSTTKGTSTTYKWILKTGHSEYTKKKNIYDIAGNLYEWTNEMYASGYVKRGGSYGGSGSACQAAYRFYNANSGDSSVGYRCMLYVL